MKRFTRGVVLPDHKYRSLSNTKIQEIKLPRVVTISLTQHVGAPIFPCVSEGDQVSIGTKLAEGDEWASVPIHSSVSGRVSKVEKNSIMIESDGLEHVDPHVQVRGEIPEDSDQIIAIIREAGIIDLGGSAQPVHHRLIEAREKNIETLILNGCESEPFLTADHVLMLNHPVEILKGAELLRIASGAKKVIIAIEKNKLEAVELINSKNYQLKLSSIQTLTLPARYPQGSERVLAQTVRGKKLNYSETPLSVGILVEHIQTAFAVYEAVALRKPFYERVITIEGPCVMEPKNIWAPIGASAYDLLTAAKGVMREPEQIIFGGPMMGEAISSLDAPITKKVSGILALPKNFSNSGTEEACIRCGKCIEVCPESLLPETLVRAVRANNQELATEYDIDACTECAACNYICPSKIPIAQVLRSGKNNSKNKNLTAVPAYALSP